jgi:hypothetical protein
MGSGTASNLVLNNDGDSTYYDPNGLNSDVQPGFVDYGVATSLSFDYQFDEGSSEHLSDVIYLNFNADVINQYQVMLDQPTTPPPCVPSELVENLRG